MSTHKIGLVVLVTLTLIFSGCDANSLSPVRPLTSIANSSKPSEMPASPKAAVSPTPSTEVTSTDGLASSTPSPTPVETSAAPATTTVKGNSGPFNEDTFTKYFQFGMSKSAVENILKELKIEITDNTSGDTAGAQSGLWRICTEHAQFEFDKNQRLYMIVSDWETAKGFNPGDSAETLHQLYGKEDEISLGELYNDSEFIYKRKDFYFSVEINDLPIHDKDRENYWKQWKVFKNIWNDPLILVKGAKSNVFIAGEFASDDCITFNEESFSKEFPLGMSRKDLIEKLNNKRVRIAGEESEITDNADDEGTVGVYVGCLVWTDHVTFGFDSMNCLDCISVYGWPTKRGLKLGDTEEKLLKLYGKDCYVQKNAGDCGNDEYTYSMHGHLFELQFGDYFHPENDALVYWTVYLGK